MSNNTSYIFTYLGEPVPVSTVSIATESEIGLVKPDNVTITVKNDGTISSVAGTSNNDTPSFIATAPLEASAGSISLLYDSDHFTVNQRHLQLNVDYIVVKDDLDAYLKNDQIATTDNVGVVRVGNGLTVAADGTLSVVSTNTISFVKKELSKSAIGLFGATYKKLDGVDYIPVYIKAVTADDNPIESLLPVAVADVSYLDSENATLIQINRMCLEAGIPLTVLDGACDVLCIPKNSN